MNALPLSLAAIGLLIRLLPRDDIFNLEDAQQAEPGGMGRDKALGLLAELKRANLVHRTRGGYKLSGSAVELFNNYVFYGNYGKPDFPYLRLLRSSTDLESRDQSVVENSVSTENPTFRTYQAEPTQQPLAGLPEPPPPVSATPPAPEKPPRPPRERKAPAPAEVKALYPALFGLTKSPRKGRKAMGCYTVAANLWREFAATPEQVAAFWDWFRTMSEPARVAAQHQRPLNPPMPRQVYEDWPQFLEWWRARQQDAVRRAAAEVRRRERPADEQVASGELARQLNPFRNRLTRPIPVATD